MFAMLGMYVQAITTGKGPVANWSEHIADPGAVNAWNYATKFTPTLQRTRQSTRKEHPPLRRLPWKLVWRVQQDYSAAWLVQEQYGVQLGADYQEVTTGKLHQAYSRFMLTTRRRHTAD